MTTGATVDHGFLKAEGIPLERITDADERREWLALLEAFIAPRSHIGGPRHEDPRAGIAFEIWSEQPGALYFEFVRNDGTGALFVFNLPGFSWFDSHAFAWRLPDSTSELEMYYCPHPCKPKSRGGWFCDDVFEAAVDRLANAAAGQVMGGARGPELYRFTQRLLADEARIAPHALLYAVDYYNRVCFIGPLNSAAVADAVCAAIADLRAGKSQPASVESDDAA